MPASGGVWAGLGSGTGAFTLAPKDPVLHLVRGYLRPGGRLIVEYDTDRGNAWVPHPFSYQSWEAIAARTGFESTRLLHTRPSRFLDRIYSALRLARKGQPLRNASKIGDST
ncbi:MAG: hypothetical protein PVG11_10500 [Anaerolineae bacterium]